jgi:hypothetical protein
MAEPFCMTWPTDPARTRSPSVIRIQPRLIMPRHPLTHVAFATCGWIGAFLWRSVGNPAQMPRATRLAIRPSGRGNA